MLSEQFKIRFWGLLMILKGGKAPGPEGFMSKFYKNLKFTLGLILQKVLTSVFAARKVPTSW